MLTPITRLLVATSACLVLGCSEERTTNNSTVVQTDGVPPDVTITAPRNGQVFRIARSHPYTAIATDNAGMASVDFRRDGLSYVVDTAPPYATTFTPTGLGPLGTHVLTADAYDQAGNQRTSGSVTITTKAGAIAGGPLADFDHSIFGATDADGSTALGTPLAAGDLNGDGRQDLVIGVAFGDGPGDTGTDRGEVVVIFGSATPAASLDLSAAAPSLVVYGADDGDFFGRSVAVGDVTGDGIDDLVVGAPGSAGLLNAGTVRGEVVVIAGSTTLPASINLAATAPRSVFYGIDDNDLAANSVAVGDVNGDGIGDLIVGATGGDAPANGGTNRGEVYLVFGSSSLATSGVLSSAGCILYGPTDATGDGSTVAAGDTDGDGLADVAVGGPSYNTGRGHVAIFYGRFTWPASIDQSSVAPSVDVRGEDNNDNAGSALLIGDMTGDGLAEVIIGAPFGDGPTEARASAGEIYILPGLAGRSGTVDLNLALTAVHVFYGRDAGDQIGNRWSVGLATATTAGTFPDLLIGAPAGAGLNNGGAANTGEVMVWNSSPFAGGTADLSTVLSFFIPLTVYGVDGGDVFGAGVVGVDLDGDGFQDIAAAAAGGDGPTNGGNNRGEVRIVAR